MKKFNAKKIDYKSRKELTSIVFDAMRQRGNNSMKSGILLTGDPGIGKTSFIRFLSKLVGIPQITIEAPHITEEHVINIPFISFSPANGTETKGSDSFNSDSGVNVVLSKSHLFQQIQNSHKTSDSQYLQYIKNAPEDVKEVFELFHEENDSDSPGSIPDVIKKIRSQFDCILFLDEYFRQESEKIKNILRAILNGKIGLHTIPSNVYVIYASNMNDEGIDTPALNADFQKIEFPKPTPDEWFGHIVSKFKNDLDVKLNSDVIDMFYNIINHEFISHWDEDAEVRISPRRWEQLLLYVNSSLPVKSKDEARALMHNVKINFSNYLTGGLAKVGNDVMKAVLEMISKTTPSFVPNNELEPENWLDGMKHQIQLKMKLGDHRSYVPVVSGPPGIAKTTLVEKLARELKLGLVYIDVGGLNADDVIGLSVPEDVENNKDGAAGIKFSEPPLLKMIKAQIDSFTETYPGKYKYILFFDELTRAKPKVFNAIRKILLEKQFSDSYKLPPGEIIIAALNPIDIGASELTHHMRDVLDISKGEASGDLLNTYLSEMEVGKEKYSAEAKVVVKKLIDEFINNFTLKHGNKEVKRKQLCFWIELGKHDKAYISFREYTDVFSLCVSTVRTGLTILSNRIKSGKVSMEDIPELERQGLEIRERLAKVFGDKIDYIFTKNSISNPIFIENIKAWVVNLKSLQIIEPLINLYTKGTRTLEEILTPYVKNPVLNDGIVADGEFLEWLRSQKSSPTELSQIAVKICHNEINDDIVAYYGNSSNLEPGVIPSSDKTKLFLSNDKDRVFSKVYNFLTTIYIALIVHDIEHEFADTFGAGLTRPFWSKLKTNKAVVLKFKNDFAKNKDLQDMIKQCYEIYKNDSGDTDSNIEYMIKNPSSFINSYKDDEYFDIIPSTIASICTGKDTSKEQQEIFAKVALKYPYLNFFSEVKTFIRIKTSVKKIIANA